MVWDKEKLAFILQQKDEKLDNIKQDYEIRIKEKDKQTSDLQIVYKATFTILMVNRGVKLFLSNRNRKYKWAKINLTLMITEYTPVI